MPNRKFTLPTPEEEVRIAAGIAADPDTMELTSEQIAKRKRGRPVGNVAESIKKTVSLRLDPDLLEAMRASGKGWQTRANETLRRELGERRKARH